MTKVRQTLIERTDDPGANTFAIVGHVDLACTIIGSAPGGRVEVELSEAGAGLPVGARLAVFPGRLSETT